MIPYTSGVLLEGFGLTQTQQLSDLLGNTLRCTATSDPLLSHSWNYSLRICFIQNAQSIQHLEVAGDCQGVIAVLDHSDADMILALLRRGVDDVFTASSMMDDDFLRSARQILQRCRLLYEGNVYREGLERTLQELKDDQQAAYQVQRRLLPPVKQIVKDCSFEHSVTPSLMVSGDFVDVIAVNDELTAFYLADVSGHGASSALITILLKNITSRLLRNLKRGSSYDLLSPLQTLERINAEICTLGMDKHLTMFTGLINHRANTLTYAVGGHHPMPVYFANGQIQVLEGRGMPVGLFPEALFDQRVMPLDDLFSLYLFSDGVLELLPKASIAEKEQMLTEKVSEQGITFASLKTYIFKDYAQAEQYPDDVTLMCVSRDVK